MDGTATGTLQRTIPYGTLGKDCFSRKASHCSITEMSPLQIHCIGEQKSGDYITLCASILIVVVLVLVFHDIYF